MKDVRTRLLVTTAILAFSGTAYAADMPVKAPPVAPAPPPILWTGFYVGAQIGGASFDPSCHTTGPFITFSALPCTPQTGGPGGPVLSSSSLSSTGFIGGGKIGYDWQWNKVVLGVVGEFDWTHLNGSGVIRSIEIPGVIAVATANEKLDWLASVRGRLGWAFDNVLFYGTAGGAWTRIQTSASLVGTCCGGDFATPAVSTTKTGVVAGGGFEYRVTPNVSVVGELLWYDFGTTNVTGKTLGGLTYTTSFTSQDVVSGTLGVNWRF
jgi:outer membrane immunogenic protein